MDRIDLFDRYIFGQLSKEEKESLEHQMSADSNLASEFNAYLLCVKGVRKEAEQDNIDFYQAMKHISRKELSEIIGKKSQPMSRENLIEQLRGRLTSTVVEGNELSGLAAISNDTTPDDEIEIQETKTDSETKKDEKDNNQSRNLRRITFIFLAIILIILIVSLLI